jgi:hypothetical protein
MFRESEDGVIGHGAGAFVPCLHRNSLREEVICHGLLHSRHHHHDKETWTYHHLHGEASGVEVKENAGCNHGHDRRNGHEGT